MKRIVFLISGIVFAAALLAQTMVHSQPNSPTNKIGRSLKAAYPKYVSAYDDASITLNNGQKLNYSDDIANKTHEARLESPDLDDMFWQTYPFGVGATVPATDFDPGRYRNSPFFDAVYGNCFNGAVDNKMVSVRWVNGANVRFTSANGANIALERVARELERLGPSFVRYLVPTSGTYNCRVIAGTNTRSMHAYGAAIDLNSSYGEYWRWQKDKSKGIRYNNRMPMEIVRIFENNGFIWGGRWYHYDTFHFEYRPEFREYAGN
ncbi:MAG: hypothetical protein FD163_1123 [Hyphomonadaceae bacterium]|nr:MAG: hypothetical protein FD163_1123 [Hyphomonadaceae bacterium]